MTLKLSALLFTLATNITLGQVSSGKVLFAKEYSKEIALYKAKTFVIEDILKVRMIQLNSKLML